MAKSRFLSLFRHVFRWPSRATSQSLRCTSLVILVSGLLVCGVARSVFSEQPAKEPPSSSTPLVVERKAREEVTILCMGKEVAVHHSGEALDKSYIHPLWTPDGRIITYDAPADHVHHRGLCVGWADVSGVDFWAEVWAPKGRRGRIVTRKLSTGVHPGGGAKVSEFNDWQDESGTTLLREERAWTFLPPTGNLQLVDVDISLTAVAAEVVLGSDPGKPREYHGLTLRMGPFDQPRFFNSEGNVGDEQCHGKAARWCALSGIQNGQPVTAAILDHPTNDSHPTKFFVLGRGMQFISSSPNFDRPKVLKSGENWRLRYRVVAAGAPPSGEQWDLQSLWTQFAR